MSLPATLLIPELLAAYRSGQLKPVELFRHVLERISRAPEHHVWISRLPDEQVLDWAKALERRSPHELPLYGIPFAIKDNIDLAGVPTTAGCPAYACTPAESAPVVARLMAAGAIPVGKTNLDQFATGLVGTRSPYGACANSIDTRYVSGGSSSGSAVAVAMGLVTFSLGTDTAGSGRVPAAFNNIIGLKPSPGRLSTRGVVPACRTLDCVSVFALTAADAAAVAAVAEGYDALDPYSLAYESQVAVARRPETFRFGVPKSGQLEFFGDTEYAQLFTRAIRQLESLGGRAVGIDFEPFRAVARLLYEGPWIAERYAAVGEFIQTHPDAVHPVTRKLILDSRKHTAVEVFRAQHRLMDWKRITDGVWREIDVLVTPTTPTIYRIAEIEAQPFELNARLGFYTNFVNFLGYAAVAAPAGFRADGLPFGVTFVGPAGTEPRLLALADALQRSCTTHVGAHLHALPPPPPVACDEDEFVSLAVCGAHMQGLPLNHQLVERDAVFRERTQTAPCYRLYALPGGPPRRPGLVRVDAGGVAIEVEVWRMPVGRFGGFVASIPAPLGIGKVELANGETVAGFLCEAYAVSAATDISACGSWRRYLTLES